MDLFESSLPPGLVYLEKWIAESDHDSIVSCIDSNPFREDLSRRTQHYGFIYDYRSAEVNMDDVAPAPPTELVKLSQRLTTEGYFHRPPDQIIINEYLSGQGIAEHIDRESFGPVVATLSLLESWPMVFRGPSGENSEVLLGKCSLALMIGDSRSTWTHEIRKRQNDIVGGLKIPRTRRLSVTFRTVNQAD